VVAERTGKEERAVRLLLLDNWPDTQFFKPVQVELAVDLIERRSTARGVAGQFGDKTQ
jgi:hypothetical protein